MIELVELQHNNRLALMKAVSTHERVRILV